MKHRQWLVLALAVLSLSPRAGKAQGFGPTDGATSVTRLRVSASVSREFGETRYAMDALTPDPRDSNVLVPIRSELVFPLDATLLGVSVDWQPGATTRWSFGAGLRTNVYEPSVTMTDSDYFQGRQIAYAESDPDVDLLIGVADVRYRLRRTQRATLALLLHLEYERIEQFAVGFEGWQGSLFSDVRVPVTETAPVLDYQVKYLSSQIGAIASLDLGPHLEVELSGAGGVLFAWDKDDHLLRERLSEGSAVGFSSYANGRLGWRPNVFGWSWLSIDLWGELRYYYAEGGVDQSWYAGSSPGTRYTDLPYTFESFQPQVGLSLTASR